MSSVFSAVSKRTVTLRWLGVVLSALAITSCDLSSSDSDSPKALAPVSTSVAAAVTSGNVSNGVRFNSCVPGTPMRVDENAESRIVDGYTDKLSYGLNEQVRVMVNSLSEWTGEIGVYDPAGKRVDEFTITASPQETPPKRAFERGFNYCVSAVYSPSASLRSGVYLIGNKIPFIYKGAVDRVEDDVVVVYPTNTVFAYNNNGGGSLYEGNPFYSRVSFLRPSKIDRYSMGLLRWYFQEPSLLTGVRFISDSDMDDYRNIASAKVIMLIGHSEYWTRAARLNFDRFVDAGKHALILSGNNMFWQVRYASNGQQLICHKSNQSRGTPDPIEDPLLQTRNWYVPSLKYPEMSSVGAEYRYAKQGRSPYVRFGGYKIVNGASPLVAGTGLKTGDIMPFDAAEFDGTPLLGFDAEGKPILNKAAYNPYRIEVVGYEHTTSSNVSTTLPLSRPDIMVWSPPGPVATWIVLQKAATAGYIINGAANWWTLENTFARPNAAQLKTVMQNSLNVLRQGKSPFSPIP